MEGATDPQRRGQAGYPDRARTTPLPDSMLARDLPRLSDPAAVKLLLHLAWRIHRRERGQEPCLRAQDLRADALLRSGIAAMESGEVLDEPAIDGRIESALETLLAEGCLLCAKVAGSAGPERWLSLNDGQGRRLMQRLEQGDARLPDLLPAAGPGERAADPAGKPTIFQLYEENIGLLSPILVEELEDAAKIYPESWIEDAIRSAVANGARSWSYVRAILQRWERDGKSRNGAPDEHASHRRGGRRSGEADRGGPADYAAHIER